MAGQPADVENGLMTQIAASNNLAEHLATSNVLMQQHLVTNTAMVAASNNIAGAIMTAVTAQGQGQGQGQGHTAPMPPTTSVHWFWGMANDGFMKFHEGIQGASNAWTFTLTRLLWKRFMMHRAGLNQTGPRKEE
jgi:hypothetical protein